MSKIFYLMGKSSSGKDTIYNKLISNKDLNLHKIVSYTTRPIREGELEGREYHFVDESRMGELDKEGRIIEKRSYQTIHGIWNYFTVNDEQIDLVQNDYLIIGTIESYIKMREYFGTQNIIPIYVEVDDGIRLERALLREKSQLEPKYSEMCRRFLADQEDFSEKNLKAANILKRYNNLDFIKCLAEITKDISLSKE